MEPGGGGNYAFVSAALRMCVCVGEYAAAQATFPCDFAFVV